MFGNNNSSFGPNYGSSTSHSSNGISSHNSTSGNSTISHHSNGGSSHHITTGNTTISHHSDGPVTTGFTN